MEWQGYATSNQFKEGTELMLNTLIKHRSIKVLANIKDMILIGMEDQQWLDTQFIPRAIRFGFKAIALVKPDTGEIEWRSWPDLETNDFGVELA